MLKSSFEITLPPIRSAADDRATFLRSMQEWNISSYQSIISLQKKRNELLDKLEIQKEELISQLSASNNVSDLAKCNMVEKMVTIIRTDGERKFLRAQIEEDRHSTLDRSLTLSYVEIANQADRVDQLIAEKYDECIAFYASFPTEKLPQLRQELLAEMKMFSERELIECTPYAHKMQDLLELINAIYDTPAPLLKKTSNETSFEIAQSQAISRLRSIQRKHLSAQEANAFDKLQLSHIKVVNTPAEITSSVRKAVEQGKLENNEALMQIANWASEGEECVSNTKDYLTVWESCLLTKTAPFSRSYVELLELLKSEDLDVLSLEVQNNVIKKSLTIDF